MAKDAVQHLENISKGEDKNNAREYLDWKNIFSRDENGSSLANVDGRALNLGKVKKEHLPFLQKLLETLVVEKSVCEARMHLLEECKAEVAKKGIIPLYTPPDIEFVTSPLISNLGIARFEELAQVFGANGVTQRTNEIVDFVNQFPKGYIPLPVIEGAHKKLK